MRQPTRTMTVRSRRLALENLEERAVFDVTPAAECLPLPTPGMGPAEQAAWALSPVNKPAPAPATFGPIQHDLPYPASETFTLHSRPGATKKIFLDFDGHTTAGTPWNNFYNAGQPFTSPTFNFEGDSSSLSDNEHQTIQGVWQRVMEDFSPFDVDVTTEDPGVAGLTFSGGSDKTWGMRVVVAADDDVIEPQPGGQIGGVAFLPSFKSKSDINCFVFAAHLANYDEKSIAEAISHEVGHTLGLSHDGQKATGVGSYYPGHIGVGTPGWAPIMGVGYDHELSQWSKGEYADANQKQDDLAIITNVKNNFGYRPDDAGNTVATAAPGSVNPTANPDIAELTFAGVIEKTTDVDVISFRAGAGPISIDIKPWVNSPNLDIKATLLDVGGRVIDTSDNPSQLNAFVFTSDAEASGTYFLMIEGVGIGDVTGKGYSDYASLGQYTVTGMLKPFVTEDAPQILETAITENAAGLVTGIRARFNVPMNLKTLTAANVKITGPGGAAVPFTGAKAVPGDTASADLTFAAQKITGDGGVRLALSTNIASVAGKKLDSDKDGVPGESDDFYISSVRKFNSVPLTPEPIPGGTTEFPLVIDRPFSLRDINVRVNLRHENVGDLEIFLVHPDNFAVRLFDNRGGTGNHLTDTIFDQQAIKSLGLPAAAPFKGVFKPDLDPASHSLSSLNKIHADGDWKLQIVNSGATTGTLLSWGLTLATNDERTPVTVTDITPINAAASDFANLTKSFTVTFSNDMNPLSVTTADFKVFNPKNAAVAVLSVKPVTGDPKSFTVTTAPWTKAGAYTIKVGPTIADTLGNSLDENGNGLLLETADTHVVTKNVERNVYQSAPAAAVIPDGKNSLTSVITIPDVISIDQIAIGLNIQHASLADLKITLISPPSPGFPAGTSFVLASANTLDGAHLTTTTFTDEAAGAITGTGPYSGDFKPETSLAPLLGKSAKGTWKLKIEDTSVTVGGLANKLLSWQIFVKPSV